MDKHFKWKHLEDLNFIATMGSAAGVRYSVDERLLARFFMFHVPTPDQATLRDIYTTLLTGHLSSFAEKVRICAAPLVEIMLTVFGVGTYVFLACSPAFATLRLAILGAYFRADISRSYPCAQLELILLLLLPPSLTTHTSSVAD